MQAAMIALVGGAAAFFLAQPASASGCKSIVGYEESIIFVECPSLEEYEPAEISQIIADIFDSRDWVPDEYLVYFIADRSLADTLESQVRTNIGEWGDSLVASYYTHSHEITLWPYSSDNLRVIELGSP